MVPSAVKDTPETIFNTVKKILINSLGVDEEEVTLSAKISMDLDADSADLLDIMFCAGKMFHIPFKRNQLFPGTSRAADFSSPLTEDVLKVLQEKFPSHPDLANITPGTLIIGDIFTVRLLCQAIANLLGVPWTDPVIK